VCVQYINIKINYIFKTGSNELEELRTGHTLTNNLYEGSIYCVLMGYSRKHHEYYVHRIKHVFHKTKAREVKYKANILKTQSHNLICMLLLRLFLKKTLANNNAVNMQK